jgi:hypothetical protein
MMLDPAFPLAEESLHRLHRSGWSTGEVALTGSGARAVSISPDALAPSFNSTSRRPRVLR